MNVSRVILAVAMLGSFGCSESELPPSVLSNPPAVPDVGKTITAKGVGSYIIGKSTMAQILGDDTSEARRRFSEQGLTFQFDRGVKLTGITITSSDFRLPRGLAVGATKEEVLEELGDPLSDQVENAKFTLDALVYPKFTFLLDGDTVSAIFIGAQ